MSTATASISSLLNGLVYSEEYRIFHKNEDSQDNFAERMKQARAVKNYNGSNSLPDTRPNIPDAMIRDWAEKYDVKNMTQKEYQAFIDDLISAGVLQESDKFYVRYDPNMVVVDLGERGFVCREVTPTYLEYCPDGYYFTLAQAGGNALRWAEGWKIMYGNDGIQYGDTMHRILSLFDEISWILGRMEDAK